MLNTVTVNNQAHIEIPKTSSDKETNIQNSITTDDKDIDHITHVQDTMDEMVQLMYTTIGILQRDAPLTSTNPDIPITAWTAEQITQRETEMSNLINEKSNLIVKSSKKIDCLLDDLVKGFEDSDFPPPVSPTELENCIQKAESLLKSVKQTYEI